MDIIMYLIQLVQYQYKIIGNLLNFICRYIPLKQWAYNDSHSPKYQKFKIDELPLILKVEPWDYRDFMSYLAWRYKDDYKPIKPVNRRSDCDIDENCKCPCCNAPYIYLYKNNGSKGQLWCKVCQTKFSPEENRHTSLKLRCPYCTHSLVPKKDRKHFIVHKCVNPNCSYYVKNLRKINKDDLQEEHGKSKYKLHYIYREFTLDFFKMDLNSLPKNASSLKFSKFDANIMGLCLTMHVNLRMSLRQTKYALKDLYNIDISHQQVANYCKTAAICIKPFVDNYDYQADNIMTADETYIKIRGVKAFIWFIMNPKNRSIIGYRVSQERDVGACILAMRMAFRHFSKLPENFKFIADGYSAYVLAAQQFLREFGDSFKFEITQVIGLTNDDAVSKEYRPFKQMIERLNRTYKLSYRPTNGFDSVDGANYDLALWVAYYNFLRPHEFNKYKVLNDIELLRDADNMPGKWQLLIFLGQQQILKLQAEGSNCS